MSYTFSKEHTVCCSFCLYITKKKLRLKSVLAWLQINLMGLAKKSGRFIGLNLRESVTYL
jgi:hypothetical protein